MGTLRSRYLVFFLLYLALLLASLVWTNSPPVRGRITAAQVHWFYVLIGAAIGYLLVRAALTLRHPRQDGAAWVWADLAVITGAVYLSGGINSEAALAYFWPLMTAAVERHPRRTAILIGAVAVLYLLATWPTRGDDKYVSAIIFRTLVLIVVGGIATSWAKTEQVLVEEVARLREEVALADYRERLSREMHDGIQHYLADITVRLELARRLAARDPATAAKVACDQRFALRQAAGELRYLVRLLRSPEVERAGFIQALSQHLELLAESAGLSAPLEIDGEARPLPADVAQAAFRITQEAIMNAQKHAAPTEVKVALHFEPDRFACTIQDNGRGFDPAAAPERPSLTGGFGLSSMKQRAESVGGSLEINSTPGEGTAVTFAVPGHAA